MRLSDEEYIYRKDIAEKKQIARGAFHKKNGSKSKKCNFPSDYLSKKEKLKMNSDCMSWNLNDFYTYNDFKKMPKDIQIEYLQKLTDTYKVGISPIGEILFELGNGTFSAYISTRGIKDKVNWQSFTGRKGAAYNAEFRKVVEHMRVAIVDHIKDEPLEQEESKEINVDQYDVDEAMASFTKAVNNIIEPIAPKTQPSQDLYQASPVNCRFVSEGFDLDLFTYLANKYYGKNTIVTIYISTKEDRMDNAEL